MCAQSNNLMPLICEMARVGDVQGLMSVNPLTKEEKTAIALSAARHGQVTVMREVVTQRWLTNNHVENKLILVEAIKYGQIPVISFLAQIPVISFLTSVDQSDGTESDEESMGRTICVTAVDYARLDVIEWWIGSNERDEEGDSDDEFEFDVYVQAKWCGKAAIMEHMITKYNTRYQPYFDDWKKGISGEDKLAVYRVLHIHNIPGEYYTRKCKAGTCRYCNTEKVWDAWIMESQKFTEMIQWLPREMVEDVVGLCCA